MGLNQNFLNEHINLTKTLGVKAEVGSDGSFFNITQTALISAISGTENNTSVSSISNAVKFNYLLLEGQANGEVVREIVFKKADGSVQAREVLPDTSKNDSLQIDITTTVVHEVN